MLDFKLKQYRNNPTRRTSWGKLVQPTELVGLISWISSPSLVWTWKGHKSPKKTQLSFKYVETLGKPKVPLKSRFGSKNSLKNVSKSDPRVNNKLSNRWTTMEHNEQPSKRGILHAYYMKMEGKNDQIWWITYARGQNRGSTIS